jgi:hypothetical protein
VVAQDTTTFNYSGQKGMEGLGYLQGNILGVLQHNVLAMNEYGIPQGLLYQYHWSRGERSSKPFLGEVESEKWLMGLSSVNESLGELNKKVVLVSDREGDIWELFKAERAKNVELITRVYLTRNIEVVSNGQVQQLDHIKSSLTQSGTTQVTIRRNNQEVCLTLSISYGAVNIYPPNQLSPKKHKTQGFSLVIATEIAAVDNNGNDVFNPNDIASWYLMTSLPVLCLDDALRVVQFYALRWRVERFHFTLKSGAFNVEKLQFQSLHATINALVYYSIIAWQTLFLLYSAQLEPYQNPEDFFSKEDIKILAAIAKKSINSLKDAVCAIASILNFKPNIRQQMPGIKLLAMAIERFQFIKSGAKLILD